MEEKISRKHFIIFNLISLGIILIFIELTCWGVLKFKYPNIYEKHSKSFLLKLTSAKAKYKDQKSNYFMLHPKFGVKFRPNTKFYGLSPDDNGQPHYSLKNGLNINNFGLVSNGKNIEKKFDKKDFIILLSGGSTTAGWGATENNKIWGSVLENKIQEYFDQNRIAKKVKVLNSGILGYAISQELDQYLNETQFLSPNIVITFNGINEKWAFKGDPVNYGLSNHQNRMIHNFFGVQSLHIHGLFPNLRILIAYLGNKGKREKFGYENGLLEKFRMSEIYLRKINNFKSLAESNSAKFYWILQPLMGVCPRKLTLKEKTYKNFFGQEFYKKSWEQYISEARSFYKIIQPKMTKDWQIDWTCLFKDEVETVYYDPRHYNDFGQKIIGESIFKFLLDHGQLNK